MHYELVLFVFMQLIEVTKITKNAPSKRFDDHYQQFKQSNVQMINQTLLSLSKRFDGFSELRISNPIAAIFR